MGVGSGGPLDRPVGGFLELAQANMGERADTEHGEHERVEGTKMARVVGTSDGGLRVTRLAVDE